VGVRLSGAERPSVSPHPTLPPSGGKEHDASLANRVPNSIGGRRGWGENPQLTPYLDPPRGEELMSPADVYANEHRYR
jgi:hypothetical protein